MEEIWKEFIDGYIVSTYGNIKSLPREVKNGNGYRKIRGKILAQRKDKNGYLLITILNKTYKVHRIVISTFNPNPNSNSLQVNHLDCNKENNYLENLSWCDANENIKHSIKMGRTENQKRNHYGAKLTETQVKEIRQLKGILKQKEIALRYNVNRSAIYNIHSNKKWKWVD